MSELQTLKLNKKVFKLYQKAKKLGSWSKEVKLFMINSSKHIPISSKQLVDLFETLVFVVEKTSIFPSEAQFRIKISNKVIYLNSSGDFLEQRLLIEDTKFNGHLNQGPIHLSAKRDLDSLDFSTFISGYFRGHISGDVLKKLCTIPDSIKSIWNIELIRTIYLKFSHPKWEPPLEAMADVQQILISKGYSRKYVRLIENALINSARLGFSPVDVLRKTIIPFIGMYGDNPDEFQEVLLLDWSMTNRLNRLFGNKNDGSTFNQYSLNKLIIPLISPNSRFTKELSISETDRLFHDIAIRWKEVFSESFPYTKNLFDNYGDIYISNVSATEPPERTRKEIIRLLNHIDFLSSRMKTDLQFKRFLKPLHVQGVEEIRKHSGNNGIRSIMRLVMQKHFELIEEYTILDFPIDYRQYMTFFSGGFIKSPDDIDFFQSAVRSIRKLNSTETDEILRALMAFASDIKETQKILDYITSCKIFDKEIYKRWRDLKEDKQDEAIYSLNKIFDRYLLDPNVDISIKELPKMDRIIENAIIKQLIKSSRLSRNDIDNMLNNKTTAMEPTLHKEFSKAVEFEIHEKEFENKIKSNQDFILSRHRFVNRGHSMLEDALYKDRLTSSIIKAGVYYYGSNYQNASIQIMNNFQTFIGEINNLTGNAAEIGRECASWILTQESDLTDKTVSIMEELLLNGILSSVNVAKMAYPPFSDIFEKPDREKFSKAAIIPLKEIYSVYFREYINSFCINTTSVLPPVARTLFQKSFPGTETMIECASIIYKNLFSHINLTQFDYSLNSLLSKENKNRSKRKIRLVGGKRKIDQFFPFASEMGFTDLFNEIKRKDFIPIRIIDSSTMMLAGYITTFMVFPANSRDSILLLSGIHVKERWIVELDEVEFYRETRKALVNFAKRVDAVMLCVTHSGEIHSNCYSIETLMKADLDEKPVLRTSSILKFPEKSFNLSEISVLWKNKSE